MPHVIVKLWPGNSKEQKSLNATENRNCSYGRIYR
jgi:hypothetical protein